MQAIITKIISATNTKPTRIKASCARGSIILSSDSIAESFTSNSEEKHRTAAMHLVKKFVSEDRKQYGTPADGNPWNQSFVSGTLPCGNWVHVFKGKV